MEVIKRRYKALSLDEEDIFALQHCQLILFQALFVAGKRPRAKITCTFGNDRGHELTAGTDIIFLSTRLKEPRVECQYGLMQCQHHSIFTSVTGLLKPKDELELVWLPDSHTTSKMLRLGLHGDSIKLVFHRGDRQFHSLLSVHITDQSDERPILLLTKEVLESELNYGT